MSGAQYPTNPVMIDTNSVIMYKDKIGMMIPIGVHELEVDAVRDHVFDTLLVRLKAYVLSEHLVADVQERTTTAPKTLWDHTKHNIKQWAEQEPHRIEGLALEILGLWPEDVRTLTCWWIRKRKINYRTITMTASWTRNATRPESTIRFPDKLGPVVYQEASSSQLWED